MNCPPDTHTADCLQLNAVWKAEFEEYLIEWPDCCRICYGTGMIFTANADDEDFCEECIYADKCPRCYADFHYQNSNSRCAACGWETLEETLPLPPGCDCVEELAHTLEGAH